jgi:hypothetical protein
MAPVERVPTDVVGPVTPDPEDVVVEFGQVVAGAPQHEQWALDLAARRLVGVVGRGV